MSWICTSCGSTTKTNRRKCRKCGSTRWKPYPQKGSTEAQRQTKRLNPKGFLLANPGKQAPNPDFTGIECGRCHTIVYPPDKKFDMASFKIALKKHYETSPDCAD
ncbi:MAG TPA: hypothetical protein VMU35_04790 [Methylomirabilota bacterium]|nr:hypothetical protein [Methylomirabilota bacterium]